jgi:hypothetical protein
VVDSPVHPVVVVVALVFTVFAFVMLAWNLIGEVRDWRSERREDLRRERR